MAQFLKIAVTLSMAGVASAQCSMCRTVAAQANGMDKAILVLFVPAIMLFSGVFLFAFRSHNDGSDGPEDA
jgi:hypothetical protein